MENMIEQPRMRHIDYLEQQMRASNAIVAPKPKTSYYPEKSNEVFKFALTKTMHWLQISSIDVDGCFPHQIFALYKKIPAQKYKSADELIKWAEQNSIPAPPIELLRQCLAAKNGLQLPKSQYRQECSDFLIRYMREVGEVCTLKFPPYEWKSPYAIDYLVEAYNTVEDHNTAPQRDASELTSRSTEPASATVTTTMSEPYAMATLTDKLKATDFCPSYSASESDSLNSSPDNSFDSDSAL